MKYIGSKADPIYFYIYLHFCQFNKKNMPNYKMLILWERGCKEFKMLIPDLAHY